jgi:hypothetical protein
MGGASNLMRVLISLKTFISGMEYH